MQVTAISTFVSPSAKTRGRICLRGDGRFQVVTETLREEPDDWAGRWFNDHPPSGIFDAEGEAETHLLHLLPRAEKLQGLEPCCFDINIGPYPEPQLLPTKSD